MAAERERRNVKDRGIWVNGQFILHMNNYDLEAGERSVWDQELAEGGGKQIADKPVKKAPRTKDPNRAAKLSSTLSAPRQLSAEVKARELSNGAIKASREAAEGARRHFFWQHRQKFAAFGAHVAPPREGLDLPGEMVAPVEQPPYIRVQMRDYQLAGLTFLAQAHAHGISAILGDEMGLGKTLQTISFLAYLKFELGVAGPHLVVAPLSVLSSWMSEFKRFCPELKVIKLHSSDPAERERLKETIKQVGAYDVVVTTYEMVKSPSMATTLAHRMHWRYMVLDEGHVIKNEESQISKAVRGFHFQNALLLTGTPLQNNLRELFALLNFLFPEQLPLSVASAFDDAFDLNRGGKVNSDMLVLAHRLLQPLMLRRLKAEVEGKLPPKLETTILCPLSETQVFWYKRLLLKEAPTMLAQLQLASSSNGDDATPSGGSSSSGSTTAKTDEEQQAQASGAQWKRLQSLMMQLRKCANHPYLFEDADPGPTDERLVEASGKLRVLDRLLPKLQAAGHRCVLFSQFTSVLDVLEDYLNYRDYAFCRLDGGTNRVQRTVNINSFNAPGSPIFCFLMSTRAGGLGVNLQTADTCILFDSDWNPQPDLQAMARVHRIGQTKKVHVYRLVTPGTVEERIVQRAEKKLYLDKMVNRDAATRDSSNMEDNSKKGKKGKKGKGAAEPEDEEEDQGVSGHELLAALSFGAQAVFSAGENQPPSDAELDVIIDRKRTDDFSSGALKGGEAKTADTFNAEQAAMNLRELQGTVYNKAKEKSFLDCKADMSDIVVTDVQTSKRVKGSRTVSTHVVGVGLVQVSKENDSTNVEGIEESIWNQKLGAGAVKAASVGAGPRRQVAGRDYDHIDFCLSCRGGEGQCVKKSKGAASSSSEPFDGSLVKCGGCPVTLHRSCAPPISLITMTKAVSKQWMCPHHLCATCGRGTSAAGGLLFRCISCPSAFCEDHLPSAEGARIMGRSRRFEALGADLPKQACYVVCSMACSATAAANGDLPEALVATSGIIATSGVDTTGNKRGCNSGKKDSASGTTDDVSGPATTLEAMLTARAAAAAAVCVGGKVRQRFGAPVNDWYEGEVVAALPGDLFTVKFDAPLKNDDPIQGGIATLTRTAVARLLVSPPSTEKAAPSTSSSSTKFASKPSKSTASFSLPSPSSLSSPSSSSSSDLVGKKFQKHFRGKGWLDGEVLAVADTARQTGAKVNGRYKVKYSNGLIEELRANELSDLLAIQPKVSPSKLRNRRSLTSASGAAGPSYEKGDVVEVLFEDSWYSGVVEAIVHAGLKVSFQQDHSVAVVSTKDLAERVRSPKSAHEEATSPAQSPNSSVNANMQEEEEEEDVPAAVEKPLVPPPAAQPFKRDERTSWERLPAEGVAALEKAQELGSPVPLGQALGPLSLLSRYFSDRANRQAQKQDATANRRSVKKASSGLFNAGSTVDAALDPKLSNDETKTLVARLEWLALVLCPDLAQDEGALAACTMDDLADRVASYTGAAKPKDSMAARAANTGAVGGIAVAGNGSSLEAGSPEEAASLYLELVRELENAGKLATLQIAQCLGVVEMSASVSGSLVKPGVSKTMHQLRNSLAAFLAWPRHGFTYVNRGGGLAAVVGLGEGMTPITSSSNGSTKSGMMGLLRYPETLESYEAAAAKWKVWQALQPVLRSNACPEHLEVFDTAKLYDDSAMMSYQISYRSYRFSIAPPRTKFVPYTVMSTVTEKSAATEMSTDRSFSWDETAPLLKGYDHVRVRVMLGGRGSWMGMDVKMSAQGWPSVTSVADSSPAAQAKIMEGDLVLAVEGKAVGPSSHVDALLSRISAVPSTFVIELARLLPETQTQQEDRAGINGNVADKQTPTKLSPAVVLDVSSPMSASTEVMELDLSPPRTSLSQLTAPVSSARKRAAASTSPSPNKRRWL